MRFTFWLSALGAATTQAVYSGDIIQYWVSQTAILVNSTLIGGLQSPPSGWTPAIVQGAQYLAATDSRHKSLAFQQLAVSHAAHNALQWIFHGTRNYGAVDASLRNILVSIGLNATSKDGIEAKSVGRKAAATIVRARADDGNNNFVDYVFGPKIPGVYQATPGGSAFPDTPHAEFVKLFAGLKDASQFEVPPPPKPTDEGYDKYVLYVKEQGFRNSTVRLPYDTDTAYFWSLSAPTVWNKIAVGVVGQKLATDVLGSAKFFAQLNFALANAGIVAWGVKFKYNNWRPVTAIQRPDIWLSSGLNISAPTWRELLQPTPSHQDYVSTHATFGGAAAEVIRQWNKGDGIDVVISNNVTLDGKGVITRRYMNLTEASVENGLSRVFGGLHFSFSSGAGIELGQNVAKETLEKFDSHWDDF